MSWGGGNPFTRCSPSVLGPRTERESDRENCSLCKGRGGSCRPSPPGGGSERSKGLQRAGLGHQFLARECRMASWFPLGDSCFQKTGSACTRRPHFPPEPTPPASVPPSSLPMVQPDSSHGPHTGLTDSSETSACSRQVARAVPSPCAVHTPDVPAVDGGVSPMEDRRARAPGTHVHACTHEHDRGGTHESSVEGCGRGRGTADLGPGRGNQKVY